MGICNCWVGMNGEKLCKCGETATVSNSPELTDYVRCKYCDSAFPGGCGIDLEVLRTKDFGVKHKKAWWDCPACGNKNLSYIFPST